MNSRKLQQLRLWIYVSSMILGAIYIWQDYKGDSIAFFIVALAMFLPYIETCSRCRKIVWLEKNNALGPMWIGGACKEHEAM